MTAKEDLQKLGKDIAMTACPENGWNWRMIHKVIMDELVIACREQREICANTYSDAINDGDPVYDKIYNAKQPEL